ncbi:hypothetical protein AGRO_0300 [Agrobacterium sp. ATCC 31749]|jgi:hypothetical protein|uniref:Uncharacterized protein n=1 Tax=Agrobacterium fabrum (strain C58 / ATCC 33970) TaxID=176299 RepID=Q8UIR3_AGRFC|nr:hypothetical protein Atu0230 [Agrobacterium fabrum str. C58]EGL66959.1 hypothetical protein AGRO_0300 [Agrobacterium sp. ATCC 31749]QKW98263.1 hypothetical protein GSF67_14945 [Agrobacterium sp. CGMCC 11546]QRM60320.1 hypothetical protein F3P66_13360 [Agrobacterium fabrum]TRB31770.1 hypothetical protein EXN51_06515 [Agrobacterium fabrum]
MFSMIATRIRPLGDDDGLNRQKLPIESSFTTGKNDFQERGIVFEAVADGAAF